MQVTYGKSQQNALCSGSNQKSKLSRKYRLETNWLYESCTLSTRFRKEKWRMQRWAAPVKVLKHDSGLNKTQVMKALRKFICNKPFSRRYEQKKNIDVQEFFINTALFCNHREQKETW